MEAETKKQTSFISGHIIRHRAKKNLVLQIWSKKQKPVLFVKLEVIPELLFVFFETEKRKVTAINNSHEDSFFQRIGQRNFKDCNL